MLFVNKGFSSSPPQNHCSKALGIPIIQLEIPSRLSFVFYLDLLLSVCTTWMRKCCRDAHLSSGSYHNWLFKQWVTFKFLVTSTIKDLPTWWFRQLFLERALMVLTSCISQVLRPPCSKPRSMPHHSFYRKVYREFLINGLDFILTCRVSRSTLYTHTGLAS